jgi:hypothetical protein
VPIRGRVKSVFLADSEDMGCVTPIGQVVLVSAQFSIWVIRAFDDTDCFDDQDWTYGINLND